MAAVFVCDELKIKSSAEKEKLRQAKEKVYLLGYYEAKMVHGEFAGEKVQDVKKKIQEKVIESGLGCKYMEPEKEVISRYNLYSTLFRLIYQLVTCRIIMT